ncbi:hypothetical protein [Pseudomonas aeruginosa]|uniref:hypothetical protein n=6 Tax=Pseudomonas aeruginosa TaxID=287 RepID=UPI00178474D9|nr:hypothetical protein [Pseudomonas aeruginosa]
MAVELVVAMVAGLVAGLVAVQAVAVMAERVAAMAAPAGETETVELAAVMAMAAARVAVVMAGETGSAIRPRTRTNAAVAPRSPATVTARWRFSATATQSSAPLFARKSSHAARMKSSVRSMTRRFGGGDGDGGGTGGNGGTGGGDGDGGGTGGGGDGGGDGQCDPAKDPNKCGSGSSISGDGDCKVAIQCNGDAIQCAIVRQEKLARCADEEFRTVDDKKIQDLKNTLAGEFSGPEYEPIKATGENTHDLSKLLDTSGRFSKACPVIPDVSFPWFGSTQTVSLSSVSSDLCTYLQWFGYLLVAFAMRSAAEIIARGLN